MCKNGVRAIVLPHTPNLQPTVCIQYHPCLTYTNNPIPGGKPDSPSSLLLGSASSYAPVVAPLLVIFAHIVLRRRGGGDGTGGGLRRIRFSSRDWIIGIGEQGRYCIHTVGCRLGVWGRTIALTPFLHTTPPRPSVRVPPPSSGKSPHY